MRDIAGSSVDTSDDEMELYWDVILLAESQFLLPIPSSDGKIMRQNVKLFQKYTVKRIGESLNQIVKSKKPHSDQVVASWRNHGLRYTLVYLPLHFKDVIWCKSDNAYFHVILPQDNLQARRQANGKEWLLALLELASTMDMQFMRLYIRRDDLNGISTFLRNLNWIGGKLVPNEDRNIFINSPTSTDSTGFDASSLGDEAFVILEFEC